MHVAGDHAFYFNILLREYIMIYLSILLSMAISLCFVVLS